MIEDAVVIYRIARAPERRIFYIDVGNLPKIKAEQYLRDIMSRYRNKLVYDASTGEIRDDRNYMSMLEDFWLPRREGGRGTEITTLPGGQNLGEIADIEYFKQKLYRSLNVPISRLESGQGFNMGRAAEISRDELKFTKFVGRLRKKFTSLFHDLLKTQLVLKGVITIEEWDVLQQQITYTFLQDGFFAELKNAEIMRERVALVREVEPYIGKYFSNEYVRTNLLKQTELDIDKQDKQMEIEKVEEPEQNQGEEDINNNIRWDAQHKYRRWYGCGRAELTNDTLYGNSWGYDYHKYLPCRVKTYKETGFCYAHLKNAIKDGYAT